MLGTYEPPKKMFPSKRSNARMPLLYHLRQLPFPWALVFSLGNEG